jgi:hypothetical protein
VGSVADPTEIQVVIGPDGPVTGEHPICGDRWWPEPATSPVEAVHDVSCWAAGHAGCRCLERVSSPP